MTLKKILFLICCLGLLFSLGCDKEDEVLISSTGIDELSFYSGMDEELKLEIGEVKKGHILVKSSGDFAVDDIYFVSTDPDVASFKYDKTVLENYVYYDITALSPGETTVFVSTSDLTVVSEKIKITVVPTEETTSAPESTSLPETTTAPETTEIFQTTAIPKTSAPETTALPDARDYVLNVSTKKYHLADCASAKKIKESNKKSYFGTPSELEDMGYTACKNCH